MPFIGIYRNLFPSSKKPQEPAKDVINVTVCKMRPASVLSMEAMDDKGNKYDISNAYYFPLNWFRKQPNVKFRYKAGERYLAEVTLYDTPDYLGNIGSVSMVKINSFGSKNYL